MLEMDDSFEIPPEYRAIFNEAVKPKLESGGSVNIFFSSNFFNFNYYYLSQFLFLSKLARSDNVRFYITLADTVLFAKKHVHFSSPMASRKEVVIQENLDKMKDILISFGIKEKNLFVVRASEAWLKFLKLDEQKIMEFYKALSLFPNNALNIPDWWIKRYYVPKKTHFSLAYVIQKYIDLFTCKYFSQIYPAEIEGKIDIFISGNAGSRLLLVAKNTMDDEKITSKDLPVLVMRGIPCFGHTALVNEKFCMPSIEMNLQEIYSVIKKYKVSTKHINLLFDVLLNKVLDEFVEFDDWHRAKKTNVPPKLSKQQLKDQRMLLAYNLKLYLENIKKGIHKREQVQYYSISKTDEIIEVNKILRSRLALDILRLANGTNSLTEISKNLDKHISNVSAVVSKLKERGFVSSNKEGKLVRTIKSLKISF